MPLAWGPFLTVLRFIRLAGSARQASLGDLVAVLLLAVIGTAAAALPTAILALVWLAGALTIAVAALRMAGYHAGSAAVLRDGWQPILLGLCISSIAGFFLGSGLDSLEGGFATLLPLINGVGTTAWRFGATRLGRSSETGRNSGGTDTQVATLAASTRAGTRPLFTSAKRPTRPSWRRRRPRCSP